MARPKVSRAMEEQVLKLFNEQGLKIRRIAKALNISRNTVRAILREQGRSQASPQVPVWARPVDWEKVKREYHSGVTLKVLAHETAPEAGYKHIHENRK